MKKKRSIGCFFLYQLMKIFLTSSAKVILKSRTLSRTSDTTETRNPCVIKVIYFLIYLISSDMLTRIFVSTRKLTFEIS
jgi:hypothetical protein